jgi:hypothetical protein
VKWGVEEWTLAVSVAALVVAAAAALFAGATLWAMFHLDTRGQLRRKEDEDAAHDAALRRFADFAEQYARIFDEFLQEYREPSAPWNQPGLSPQKISAQMELTRLNGLAQRTQIPASFDPKDQIAARRVLELIRCGSITGLFERGLPWRQATEGERDAGSQAAGEVRGRLRLRHDG